MVNREKRAIARRLVQQLVAGAITNDDFEDGYPRDRNDPALNGIYWQLWLLWNDSYTHTLPGDHSPKGETIVTLNRCTAFLGSDLEYKWPPGGSHSFKAILCKTFGFKRLFEAEVKQELERLSKIGNFNAWPFLNE